MQVQYDTFITVYMSDCDFYPRVRAAGFKTIEYNQVSYSGLPYSHLHDVLARRPYSYVLSAKRMSEHYHKALCREQQGIQSKQPAQFLRILSSPMCLCIQALPNTQVKVYDLHSPVDVPWGDWAAAKSVLDAHEKEDKSRLGTKLALSRLTPACGSFVQQDSCGCQMHIDSLCKMYLHLYLCIKLLKKMDCKLDAKQDKCHLSLASPDSFS